MIFESIIIWNIYWLREITTLSEGFGRMKISVGLDGHYAINRRDGIVYEGLIWERLNTPTPLLPLLVSVLHEAFQPLLLRVLVC
ncbi:hypothetical protein [Halarchaeum sp. P4]|uniref:hypothetical protein n=1 Tax=Halarchaeum sp. P4 TaxID=3421639 RepID=UPI003EBBB35D